MLIDAMPAAPTPKVSSTFTFNSSPSIGNNQTAAEPNAMPRHTQQDNSPEIQTINRTNAIQSQTPAAGGAEGASTVKLANSAKKSLPFVLAIVDPVFGNKSIEKSSKSQEIATPKLAAASGNFVISVNGQPPSPPSTGKVFDVNAFLLKRFPYTLIETIYHPCISFNN